MPRSFNASITSETLPCCRYRTPPWASLVLRLDVPFPKSLCSSSSTSYPRLAASIATPTPVAPPPTTIMSQGSRCSPTRAQISARFIFEGPARLINSDKLHDSSSDAAADQRPDHRHQSVSPIGAALVLDRQNCVRNARSEVACWINRVSSWTAQTQTDTPDQDSPEPRAESGGQARRRQLFASKTEAHHHQAGRQDHFTQEIKRKLTDRRLVTED